MNEIPDHLSVFWCGCVIAGLALASWGLVLGAGFGLWALVT